MFQVIADRAIRPMQAGRVRIEVHTSRIVKAMPVKRIGTETGTMVIATPETTAFDVVRFFSAVGHWSNAVSRDGPGLRWQGNFKKKRHRYVRSLVNRGLSTFSQLIKLRWRQYRLDPAFLQNQSGSSSLSFKVVLGKSPVGDANSKHDSTMTGVDDRRYIVRCRVVSCGCIGYSPAESLARRFELLDSVTAIGAFQLDQHDEGFCLPGIANDEQRVALRLFPAVLHRRD